MCVYKHWRTGKQVRNLLNLLQAVQPHASTHPRYDALHQPARMYPPVQSCIGWTLSITAGGWPLRRSLQPIQVSFFVHIRLRRAGLRGWRAAIAKELAAGPGAHNAHSSPTNLGSWLSRSGFGSSSAEQLPLFPFIAEAPKPNALFDESGNFLLYSTLLGIKVRPCLELSFHFFGVGACLPIALSSVRCRRWPTAWSTSAELLPACLTLQ